MKQAVIGVVLLLSACGGGSSTPTAPTVAPSLAAGKYSLLVSSSGAGCLVIVFGTTTSPPPDPTMVIDLDLVSTGSDWRGTLADQSRGTLVLTATLSQARLVGTLDGVATDGTKSATFLSGIHAISGSSTGKAHEFSGGFSAGALVTFSGSMTSESGTSSVTCPGMTWTLSPK